MTDTTVSNMMALEDAFIGTGTDTRVFLTRTTIENNLLQDRWRIMSVRDGAQGRAMETTISRNTALQFGFTASSSRSRMLIDDSFFVDNFGLGVSQEAKLNPMISIITLYHSIIFLMKHREMKRVLQLSAFRER